MVTKEGRKRVKIPLWIIYNNDATRNYIPTHEGLYSFLISVNFLVILCLYPE